MAAGWKPGTWLWLGLVLTVAGCFKVGPDYVRPPLAVNEHWSAASGPKLQPDAPGPQDWWRSFKDPLLDRLIERAWEENLPLQQAAVRILEARALLGVAVGELFPQEQRAFGALTKERVSAHGPAQEAMPLNYRQAQLGVQASWELDFWGRLRRGVEAANAEWLAAVAAYDNALVSLTAEVADTYIRLRLLEKRLEIARSNVTVQQEALEIARYRFQGGVTSARDVEQAQTVLAATAATIPTLEAAVRQAQNALAMLVGRPPGEVADLRAGQGRIPLPPPTIAVGIPADLLRRRPDLRQAEWQAAAQCARIGIAKADLLPTFYLRGTFSLLAADPGGARLADLWQWRSREGSFGPAFQWNILNYGRLANLVRVQDARFQEALLAYQQAVLRAQQEVEDALIGFSKAEERARLLEDSTAAASRSLNLALIQYREGITDFTTVLTAEQNLLAQQDSLAATMGEIALSAVSLYRALGGGWEIREGRDWLAPATKEAMARRTNWGRLLAPPAAAPVKASPVAAVE